MKKSHQMLRIDFTLTVSFLNTKTFFFIRNVFYMHLQHVKDGVQQTQCHTIKSSMPYRSAIRKCFYIDSCMYTFRFG